jgi:imidazole glycerol-phosphate synthase subunit HisH
LSARPAIAVVDYGMGNRRSVQKALEHVGARATITAEHEQLRAADGLVVPGVGAFPLAMQNVNQLGLGGLLREAVGEGKPLLGICLGMQLLFEGSAEIEPTTGLSLLPGTVTRLQTGGLRVPHIGWNEVRWERESPLTAGLLPGERPFYHVHSLAARPARAQDIVATTEYGERFATIVQRENVFGVQFHPEKSSADGLAMLANFVGVVRARTARQAAAVRV